MRPAAAATVVLGLVALVLPGCGGTRVPQAEQLTQDPYARAALARGRSLYLTRCSGCHALYVPAAYAPAAWPGLVADMRRQAKLDQPMEEAITAYLVAASAAP